ncbi:MAG: glycoside hydrolase [Gammaproteobacteria bacterium]|nr:glycoside hydrolase [Gammaproteobacteria bacterium]
METTMNPRNGLLSALALAAALLGGALSAHEHAAHGSPAKDAQAVMVSSADHKAQSPEIALGPDGSVHMVWIDENTAAPPADHAQHGHSHVAATNLLYARSTDGGKTFSAPVQLNQRPGDVWGFSVSKPRVVAGANGTVHVFYPGNDVNPVNGKPEAVALYTRSTDGGRSFGKPQRLNEMATTDASDLVHGGLTHAHVFGTIAADGKGSVYALWIDTRDMAKEGDSGKVFMAVSRNDGASFEKDHEVLPADVCPCCQLTAFVDGDGRLYVGSRQVEGKYRDSTVMVSADGGRSFSPRQRVVGTRWEIEGCPLKPTSVVAASGVITSAYYTAGEQPPGAYLTRSTDGGKTWSKPMLAHPEAVTSDAPVLTLAGRTLHVFWHAKMADGVRRVFTRASADMGASFGPIAELPTPAGVPSQLPAVAGRADGSVQVAWQQGTEVRTARWVAPGTSLTASAR